ncbi:hypothetical protein [Marinobacter sp. HL-58]|uniref:hypothetical protein n=1 Tax=Marinobacter sp. HL-58 TaxID=1479237 RepID=UPI00048893EF|nr:hypothetical protein [Marinobacter sp. HL-58]KPP97644.1 MAG: hypothetical protein HLUCCO03_10735 [Marinobacter sp. HL-58]
MKSERITPVDFQSGKQRTFRYAFATINTITLMGTLVFLVWILGKIIGALHVLVFSLIFAETPEQSPKNFLMQEHTGTWVEAHSTLQYSENSLDSEALYAIDPQEWDQ